MLHRPIAILAISAFTLLSSSSVPKAMSGGPDTAADAGLVCLADLAAKTGVTAALVAQCNYDPALLRSAYKRALDESAVDPSARARLWDRYNAAESLAASAVANRDAPSCAGVAAMIKNMIYGLERPNPCEIIDDSEDK